MAHVEMVPVRHRRLAVFFAPEPRPSGGTVVPAVEWNLEGYQLAPRGTKIIRAGAGRRLRAAERLALKSEADGVPRFLPDVLSVLYRGGEVPAEALPGLLQLLGPTLGRHRRDFEPVLARSRAWRTVALLGLVLFTVFGLAGAAFWLPEPVRAVVFGPGGGGGPVRVLSVDGPGWLATPMRAATALTTADFAPALATAELPAGYGPPPGQFEPPPPPGADRNPPGFTLARVAATGGGGEERLVLCNSYERQLLPRVLLRGQVVAAADLALPAATLAQIGRGARNLRADLVLCQGVSRRHPPSGARAFLAAVALVLGALLTLPTTVLALVIWRRQAVRRRQVRDLRAKLGLPAPPVAAAVAAVTPP